MPSYTRVANGNIKPSRFVKIDVTAGVNGRVLQSGTGDRVYGVSQSGTRRTPYGGLDDGFAAIAGENLRIYGPDEKDIPLVLGGTVVQGDRLKSDTNGAGVATTSANDELGAIAMRAGVSGDIIPVQVIYPTKL